MTEEIANRAYDVLVEECGAREDGRDGFVDHVTKERPRTEYRFQGSLGFGGKFWVVGRRCYVNCYIEDQTPERTKIILKANEILSAVVTPYL